MMRTVIPTLLLLTAAACSAADEVKPIRLYGNAAAVYGFLGDFDDTPGASVSAGVEWKAHHAIEAEVTWLESSVRGWSSSEMTFLPVLASYRYSFDMSPQARAYVGGSIGTVIERFEAGWMRSSTQAFAVGGKCGLEWRVTSALSADLGGTVLGLDSTRFTTSGTITYVSLGAKLRF
jgi:Outer membrane protein beta-barrel domain